MREVYLYQTVHVLDGECLCLREHLAVLDRWSRTLFGCPGPQDAREVGTAVAAVVGREAPGSDRSKFVRLVLPASGSLRLEFEGVSLYRGYDLRSLMPEAVTLQYEPPLFDAPTSAREAAVELARQYAGLQGASVAVRCDRNGTLMAADEAALFAIRGRRGYAPAGSHTKIHFQAHAGSQTCGGKTASSENEGQNQTGLCFSSSCVPYALRY